MRSEAFSFTVGIDIASLTFAVRLLHDGTPVGAAAEFENRAAGFAQVEHWLNRQGATPAQTLVVMEATGVYWEECALYLHGQGYRVNVVNPAQVKGYARTTLRRAKTDATDADLIARFAWSVPLPRWQPPSLELEALQLLIRQREAYLSMLTQEKNRLHALERRPQVPRSLVKSTKEHIRFLERQVQKLEDSFKSELKQYPQWQQSLDLLQSIPGVGPIIAAVLLTETGAFASFVEARQLTAYAGIAPVPYTSGSSVKRPSSISKVGNARLRRALYMAALSASRTQSMLGEFYRRLRAKGKPAKVALVALARKILVIALALVRSQKTFDPLLAQTACQPT